jgi:hypothetical protein
MDKDTCLIVHKKIGFLLYLFLKYNELRLQSKIA